MFTEKYFTGIALADKFARSQEISKIYSTFFDELPELIRPKVKTKNTDQIFFADPSDFQKGLFSGITFETAHDPNAGRSTSRQFAHLSEVAFYRYASDIDEGIQNSIPLDEDTFIIKESTANGKAGIGKTFYDLWQSAKNGESIYKPFFVAWYEVDDYKIKVTNDVELTKSEIELQKENPKITIENLLWRRLKLSEYQTSDEENFLTPEERFQQDFPSNDVQAFLSTGQPIFDLMKLDRLIDIQNKMPTQNIKDKLNLTRLMNQFTDRLKIFSPPRSGTQYFLGLDVSLGLAQGDNSAICVIDSDFRQCASWVGKIDPDILGHLVIDIAQYYNQALVIPEVNNMGHTTLTSIRNAGYSKIYREKIEDKKSLDTSERLGWHTTQKSKNLMLNQLIKLFRDDDIKILDKSFLIEMSQITRGENGSVELNGKDRVVSLCLACMGRLQTRIIHATSNQSLLRKEIYGTGEEIKKAFEKQGRRDNDLFS
jgi:hypothetical protein